MKLTWLALGIAMGVQADTTHLTNGKSVTGRVVGFSAMTMIQPVNWGGSGDTPPVAQVTGRDLTKHIVAGKVTIVDFYADWCGPCRRIGPVLEKLARNDPDVVLRKVNVDQNGALSAQYGVRTIPLILVFDKAGKQVGKITGADAEGVKRLVAQAKGG